MLQDEHTNFPLHESFCAHSAFPETCITCCTGCTERMDQCWGPFCESSELQHFKELVAHFTLVVSLAQVPLPHVIPQLLGVMTSFATDDAILGT